MQSNKPSSGATSEIVAFHKVKRILLIEKEDPNDLQICEFNGQDFE